MTTVVYNGGELTYFSCSSPKLLVVGQSYEVKDVIYKNHQKNYILADIPGFFNADGFDEKH